MATAKEAIILQYPRLPPAGVVNAIGEQVVNAIGEQVVNAIGEQVVNAIGEQNERAMSLEDRAIARLLISVWAIHTGRVLRAVPVNELTSEELVNFWADDQIEEPQATSVPEGPPR